MLRALADDLWVAEDDLFPGFGTHFPVRMVVARVGDGLWVHSPIALDAFADAIDALGTVKWIVNPCGFHGKWLPDAVARWPQAQVLCSSAHRVLGTKLPPYDDLDPQVPAAWSGVLDSLLIEGAPKVAETVFLHRPSRTLVVCDLLFNIHETKAPLMPWVLRMVGAWKRPHQSRLWRLMVKDRAAAGRSVEQVLAWDFDRVVMAHGEILEQNAKARLAAGLQWMLGGRPAPALPAPS